MECLKTKQVGLYMFFTPRSHDDFRERVQSWASNKDKYDPLVQLRQCFSRVLVQMESLFLLFKKVRVFNSKESLSRVTERLLFFFKGLDTFHFF